MSLTGDPATDALVPIAQQLIGAVRDFDADTLDQIVADAIEATAGRCDPTMAIAIVLAAMVPDDVSPSALLAWIQPRADLDRLTGRGVSPRIARELIGLDCTA